jgi:dihydropteroate synthase
MDRLSASVGVSAYATLHDVDILRVHDVEETKSMINIIGQLAK